MRMFSFFDKSGANQRHMRATCDVFLSELSTFCETFAILSQEQGGCLLSNGKLRLTRANDLSRSIPDKLLQRSGQMRLIEIARLIHSVKDRNPLP
jgi:hypothetical protein